MAILAILIPILVQVILWLLSQKKLNDSQKHRLAEALGKMKKCIDVSKERFGVEPLEEE